MKEIINITSKGIKFKNEKITIEFASFEECNKNWIEYKKRKTGKETVTNLMYIGQRDSTSEPMFIELFTKPFTRFEFLNREEYNKVRDEILQANWKLLDLS